MKFDSSKWKVKDDIEYPYRDKMLKDLTTNHRLVGLHYSELINLLGNPQFVDSTAVVYEIMVDYGHNMDPSYTKYLDFTFSSDSVMTSFKINETKK